MPLAAASKVVSDDLGLIDLVERDELKRLVHKAITDLPETQGVVVTLFYIANYSQKEIAVFLELPLTTVKKRLYDARKRLKERMIMVQDYFQENRPSKDDQFVSKVLDVIVPVQEAHGEAIYQLLDVGSRKMLINGGKVVWPIVILIGKLHWLYQRRRRCLV